jgi:hypothetical protein
LKDAMTNQPLEDDDPFADALLPRDRYKRPLIVPADGGKAVPYTRASTFANELDNGGGLTTWKVRTVALGVARNEDIAAQVASLRYNEPGDLPADATFEAKAAHKQALRDLRDDKIALDELTETAIHRVDGRASYGTAVHAFTDPLASPHVPERMDADVKSYFAAMEKHGIEQVLSERFVVCDELQVAGTFDGTYRVPRVLLEAAGYNCGHEGTEGLPVIGDKKTGSIHEVAVAIQTSVYSRGQLYTPELDGSATREPLGVRQDVALLIHIPKGKGETHLYLVDLRLGWAAANLAVAVRDMNARKDIMRPLVSTPTEYAGGTIILADDPPAEAPKSFARLCGDKEGSLTCGLKFRHRGDHRDAELTWPRRKGKKVEPAEPMTVTSETLGPDITDTFVIAGESLASVETVRADYDALLREPEPATTIAEPVATEPTPDADIEAADRTTGELPPNDIQQLAAEMEANRQRVLAETAARYKAGLAEKAAAEEARLAARTNAERIADAPTVDALLALHAETGATWTDDDKALATARRNLLLTGLATTPVSA